MKIPDLFKNTIDSCHREEFRRCLLRDNLNRGRIMAVVVIIFETVIAAADIAASVMKADSRFNFNGYLAMYLLMIALNAVYLLCVNKAEKKHDLSDTWILRLDAGLVVYTTFIMSWGSVVTLMDQELYGQMTAFAVNMFSCSVVYMLDHRKSLVPFSVSVLILAVGLPYFQKSSDILIGHYLNLFIFISISWLASRIIYNGYCRNFNGRVMLNKSNKLLENEIEENRKINIRLARANDQLKELTLLDELTGIPNRRSFRDFIERAFESFLNETSTLSIMMIDIDFFKQFNDYYGHEAGDRALTEIAGRINAVAREPFEFAVRWGGEEFIYAAFNISRDAA